MENNTQNSVQKEWVCAECGEKILYGSFVPVIEDSGFPGLCKTTHYKPVCNHCLNKYYSEWGNEQN